MAPIWPMKQFLGPEQCSFWWGWGLNLGFMLRCSMSSATLPVHFVFVILEMGSLELFFLAGLKP
jgi:hypothetical protein